MKEKMGLVVVAVLLGVVVLVATTMLVIDFKCKTSPVWQGEVDGYSVEVRRFRNVHDQPVLAVEARSIRTFFTVYDYFEDGTWERIFHSKDFLTLDIVKQGGVWLADSRSMDGDAEFKKGKEAEIMKKLPHLLQVADEALEQSGLKGSP